MPEQVGLDWCDDEHRLLGSVIKKTDTANDWDSVIAKACGVAVYVVF